MNQGVAKHGERTLNRTVILTLFLTLVLDFEPFDSSVSIHNGSNSILIALKADHRGIVARNSPGLSPRSRQTSTVPPSLKRKSLLSFTECSTDCFMSDSFVGRYIEKPRPGERSLWCVLERLLEKSKRNPM